MRRLSLVLLLLLVAASTLEAQPSKKQPWELTLEERIALRTDPVAAKGRVNAKSRVRNDGAPPDSSVADSFDGKHNPELFLPHQVFDQLVKLAFETDARMGQNFRREFTPDARERGLPADFWLRLEALSAAYRSDYRAILVLIYAHPQTPAQRLKNEHLLALKYQDACRSRADALAAARDAFGRERFDRFLYEVMAYRMFSAADKLPDPDVLRQAETGCR